jgi:NADH:ubiquinone oxidoreductase subunit E
LSESDDDRRKALRGALSEKFPRERGHLLPALHHVQHELGYLPGWAMEAVGRHLRVANSEVYGAATSYSELRLSPPARHTLRVCTGLSCWLNGGGDLLDRLSEDLGVQPGDVPADGATALEETPCGFLCGVAPAVQWDGRWLGRATVESVSRILAEAESE